MPALAETGIGYVTVDDYHFFCTGKAADELDGFFSTEEDGTRLDLFPISEALRYRLPFSPAHEVIGYLEGLADEGHAAAIYFDDIEKFGIWPETYDWVYEPRLAEGTDRGRAGQPEDPHRDLRRLSRAPTRRAASSTCRPPRTAR